MWRDKPFVPTHRLKDAIPQLNLKKGTLLRQINPFAGGFPGDHLMCLDENDWYRGGESWIFIPAEVEPLDNWEEEKNKMIENIMRK